MGLLFGFNTYTNLAGEAIFAAVFVVAVPHLTVGQLGYSAER